MLRSFECVRVGTVIETCGGPLVGWIDGRYVGSRLFIVVDTLSFFKCC